KPSISPHQVEPVAPPGAERLGNRPCLHHLVAGPGQEPRQLRANDLLILHHQDAAHALALPRASATLVPDVTPTSPSSTGNSTSTVVPSPGPLWTRRLPPCSRTIESTSGSPSPVPCPGGLVV